MNYLNPVPLSILDLAPIPEDYTAREALRNSVKLAQKGEELGYTRYWMAEHHNLIDIASAATAVALSHIGAHTQRIRIGSGGIMLPNHAPLIVAEQFGTLEALYPERIDLGLGRAPGTDQQTMRALRRDSRSSGSEFPEQLEELQALLAPAQPGQRLRAVPGAGSNIPIWLLGSSTFSAQLAAQKGLPMAFAAHFAPDVMMQAIDLYQANFRPSSQLNEPYVMICINIVAADTTREAEYLATTEQQKFLNMIRGAETLMPRPVEQMQSHWRPEEERHIRHQLRESIYGDQATVRERLEELVERTEANEVMVNAWIHDAEARLYSYEIVAQSWF